MMKRVLSYNIHDVIKFQIILGKRSFFEDLVDLKFFGFRVDDVDKPDIVLNIGKFTPENRGCYLIDHQYYIKGMEEGNAEINFNTLRMLSFKPSPVFPFLHFLLPQAFLSKVLQHRLALKNCFLLHGAAIGKDGQAILLCGRAGSFKTSLCMDFVRKAGFDFLGDDWVIVREDEILGFPIGLPMFTFMTGHVPDETYWGLDKQLWFVSRYLFGSSLKQIERKAKSAKLKALLFITKSEGQHPTERIIVERLAESNQQHLINRLVTNVRLEDFKGLVGYGIDSAPFLKYGLAYSFVFPDSTIASYEKRLREGLNASLAPVPKYQVKIPSRYNEEVFTGIYRYVTELLGERSGKR
jgi:hypothetical protein